MNILLLVQNRSSKIRKPISDLQRVYGGNIEVRTSTMSEKTDYTEILSVGANCDVLAGDFSMEILKNLINPEKNTKPVVLIRMQETEGGFKYVGLAEVKNKMVFEEL